MPRRDHHFTRAIALWAALSLWGCDDSQGETARDVPLDQELPSEDQATPPGGDDFTPPQGRAAGKPDDRGPWAVRLMIATAPSVDASSFERTGQVVIDQANVPDMVEGPDGTIYLYFTGGLLGDRENVTAVALSSDRGATWTFKHVDIEGAPGDSGMAFDPDVVRLDDGTFRLFYTGPSATGSDPVIHRADSADGLRFDYGGVALEAEGEVLIDSTTFKLGDTWHMILLSGLHATSTDGETFQPLQQESFQADGVVASNPIFTASGIRLVGFNLGAGTLLAYDSTDALSWTLDPTPLLTLDTSSGDEADFIKDPAILALDDGSLLVVYVTKIP